MVRGERVEAGGRQGPLHAGLGAGVEPRQLSPLFALRDVVLLAESIDLLGIQIETYGAATSSNKSKMKRNMIQHLC